jgi:hypothetical protein
MGWATHYIARLAQGERVRFRPLGTSMQPKINSGDWCTVEPVDDARMLAVGHIVLCTVRGKQYLHLVKAVDNGRFLIGNNRGHLNGWIQTRGVHGRLVSVVRQ